VRSTAEEERRRGNIKMDCQTPEKDIKKRTKKKTTKLTLAQRSRDNRLQNRATIIMQQMNFINN
jgi:hypothetical protein